MTKKTICIPFAFLFALTLVGCGDAGTKTTPVRITITQKGSPLEGAAVTMVSANGNSAGATTNAAGVAEMELTGASKKGVLPGEYTVAVRKWEIKVTPAPTEESPDNTRS